MSAAAELEDDFADLEEDEQQDDTGDAIVETNGNDEPAKDEDATMVDAPEETSWGINHQIEGDGFRNAKRFMATVRPLLDNIKRFTGQPVERHNGRVDDHPEYATLTDSNEHTTEVDDLKFALHKDIIAMYSRHFPELETLLRDPIQYTKAAGAILNARLENITQVTESADNIWKEPLSKILTRPQIMTITLEASTSRGRPLTVEQTERVKIACKTMMEIDAAKNVMIEYVQSRMVIFAPNLASLCGSQVAARLLAARGGLMGLSTTRPANLPSIGTKHGDYRAGLSRNVNVRNQGFIYETPFVRECRVDYRTQAMRMISAKIVLAARIDLAQQSTLGEQGEDFLKQIRESMKKNTAAPPSANVRALPAPDEVKAKKRGGRKARALKAQTAMTEMAKAQNRMAFGKEEAEIGQGDSAVGLGMIGQDGSGKIRAIRTDDRNKAKLSKKNLGWADPTSEMTAIEREFTTNDLTIPEESFLGNQDVRKTVSGLRTGIGTSGITTGIGTAAAASGTASSLAFGQREGLDLIDPRKQRQQAQTPAQEKPVVSNRFFETARFHKLQKPASNGASSAFKVPALPIKRKADETADGAPPPKKTAQDTK